MSTEVQQASAKSGTPAQGPPQSSQRTAMLTMSSADCLGEAFRLLDGYRRTGAPSATNAPSLSSSDQSASLDKGLEMLLVTMEHLGPHLLPSCDAIGRRLSRLFPNRADLTIHSPLYLWRTLRVYCTVFGASSSKVLGDCLQQAIERPSATGASTVVASIPSSSVAVTGVAATAAVTLGYDVNQQGGGSQSAASTELSTPVLSYFGGVDAPELSLLADALLCAGPYVNGSNMSASSSASSALSSTTSATQLIQQFAQRVAVEVSQVLSLSLEPFAGRPHTKTSWANIVALLQALVFSCRPLPAIVLSVAQRVCHSALASAPRSTDLSVAVHQLRAACKLVTMPEALPWYIPPCDVVAAPQAPQLQAPAAAAPLAASAAAPVIASRGSLLGSDVYHSSAPVPSSHHQRQQQHKEQQSAAETNDAHLPRHPALFAQPHVQQTPKASTPKASPRHIAKASPAARPQASPKALAANGAPSPAGGSQRRGGSQKRLRTEDEDDDEILMPDIVLQ